MPEYRYPLPEPGYHQFFLTLHSSVFWTLPGIHESLFSDRSLQKTKGIIPVSYGV